MQHCNSELQLFSERCSMCTLQPAAPGFRIDAAFSFFTESCPAAALLASVRCTVPC
jgi:hypothetical protein